MAATAQEVKVPDIGDFADIPIIEIHVAAGDAIGEEDPLITLESDKATMDVPSPASGVVQEMKVEIGDTVSEGSTILTLAEGGPDQARVDASLAAPASHEAAAMPSGARGAPAGDGGGPADASVLAPAAQEAAAVSGAPPAPVAPAGDGGAPEAAPAAAGGPVYASPSVRRLARELGVDLTQVAGTGRKGRIVPEDVRAFQEGGGRPAAAPAKAPAAGATDLGGLSLPAWPTVDFSKFGPIEVQPLSRIQKISGPALHRNWVMIPHVTHNDEADITELEAFRKGTNEAYAKEGVRVTLLGFVLKALASVLKEHPAMNASLDGDNLVLKRYYHLGFAADTPNGLVVPVIRDVDQKGVLQISRDLADLSKQARDGKLGPAAMQGGTFSVSSLGGIGGTTFTPIVNAPEVAILGMARSAMRPVWKGGEFVPRLIQPLSLSYDHRVIDGAAAARFSASLVRALTDMRRILL